MKSDLLDYVRIMHREELRAGPREVPVVGVIAERVRMYHKGDEVFDPMDIRAVY